MILDGRGDDVLPFKVFDLESLPHVGCRCEEMPETLACDNDHGQGWIALDLGNIILHLFLQRPRDHFDLEVLWTVGPLYDDLYNSEDPEIIQLLNLLK